MNYVTSLSGIPRASCRTALKTLLSSQIAVLDGATGTMIQSLRLGEEDYRGDILKDHAQDLNGNNRPERYRTFRGNRIKDQ